MNFEKWMKKRGNNKLNAYAKNPYRVSWIKRLPLWSKIVVPSALAMTAAVVIISVGVLPNFLARGKNASMSRGPKYSSANYSEASNQDPKSVPQDSHSTQMSTSGGPEQSADYLSRIFPSITYDNIEYTLINNSGSSIVPVTHIDELLFNGKMKTVTETNIDVEIYSIKNIDKEVAVAFKTKYISNYYAYINLAAHFHDIDDFVNLLSPASEIKVDKVLYYDKTVKEDIMATYINYQDTAIYDIWFDDGTIEGYTAIDYDYESSYKYYYVGLKVPAFDGYTFTAYFYDSGYIVFNFLEQNHIFKLGQERYQAFTTYLTNTAQHH